MASLLLPKIALNIVKSKAKALINKGKDIERQGQEAVVRKAKILKSKEKIKTGYPEKINGGTYIGKDKQQKAKQILRRPCQRSQARLFEA